MNAKSSNSTTGIDASAVTRVRMELQKWLSRKRWTPNEVSALLLGYALPPLGYDWAPDEWIAHAIADEEQLNPNTTIRLMLAERLAQFLPTCLEAVSNRHEREELLNSLFHICVRLANPSKLGPGLLEIYRKLNRNRGKLRPSLQVVFAEALAHNQIDDELEDLWLRLISGEQDRVISNNPQVAFSGLCQIPTIAPSTLLNAFERLSSASSIRDELLISALSSLIFAIDRGLPGLVEKRSVARRANRLRRGTDPAKWDELVIRRADRDHWPTWAVLCLESLFVPLPPGTEGMRRWLTWCNIFPFLRSTPGISVRSELCESEVYEIESEQSLQPFESIISAIETARLQNPYSSSSAMLGALLTVAYSIEPPRFAKPTSSANVTVDTMQLPIMEVAANVKGVDRMNRIPASSAVDDSEPADDSANEDSSMPLVEEAESPVQDYLMAVLP